MGKAKPSDVESKIIEIIVADLGVDEEDVTPSASLRDDLGADSLDQMELVMALEDAFDIEISDDEVDDINTVQDVIDHVNKLKK